MKSSINVSKENNKEKESAKSNPIIENIKSRYILSKIYANLNKKKTLVIIKYNIKIQKKLNINIKDYEKLSEIEIEIIPVENEYGEFININENNKLYYHIYFNDNKEEIKNKYEINEADKVTKIKIIIDYQVKSLNGLFYFCKCIKSINFKKFYRNNINDISWIFFGCSSLREINLCNFNTKNVSDMSHMFSECSSLTKIILSNFNTENVTDMNDMFSRCSSLKELNLSNFNTNNVTDMSRMFHRCLSLKKLNLFSFNANKEIEVFRMFYGCSNDLKKKIIDKIKNLKKEAFK